VGEVDGLVLPELPDGPPEAEAKVVVVVELVVKLQNANAHPFP